VQWTPLKVTVVLRHSDIGRRPPAARARFPWPPARRYLAASLSVFTAAGLNSQMT
jgi:hypothetical protein